jgi:acyl-coenzyme A thioesterase PaaI-like protein
MLAKVGTGVYLGGVRRTVLGGLAAGALAACVLGGQAAAAATAVPQSCGLNPNFLGPPTGGRFTLTGGIEEVGTTCVTAQAVAGKRQASFGKSFHAKGFSCHVVKRTHKSNTKIFDYVCKHGKAEIVFVTTTVKEG